MLTVPSKGRATRMKVLSLVTILMASFFVPSTHAARAYQGSLAALSAPSPLPAFPTTSATLVNRAGINSMPGMRPWRYNGPNPDGWWCHDGVDCYIDPHNPYASQSRLAMIDREMQLMAQLGVSTVRTEFDWPLIEPQKGVYDWSRA